MITRRRKFGREKRGGAAAAMATHRIVIGFDKNNGEQKGKRPGKLPGFLIQTSGVDGNTYPVDYEVMEALGYNAEQIEAAKKVGDDGQAGKYLPSALYITLAGMARLTPDGYWAFPNFFQSGYRWTDQQKCHCVGDGLRALRRMGDGTRREIECIPVGADDVTADRFCQESVAKKCKPYMELAVRLWLDPECTKPASRRYGSNAVYRLQTSSDISAASFQDVLQETAETLKGDLQGIRGMLIWRRVIANNGTANVAMPRVSLLINGESVRERLKELRTYAVAVRGATPPVDELEAAFDHAEASAPDDESAAWQEHASGEAPPEPRPANLLDDRNQATARVEEPAPVDVGATQAPADYPGVLPEDATYPELYGALYGYAMDVANETGSAPSVIIGDLTATPYKKGDVEGVWKAKGLDEFRNATGASREKLHRLLIQIARKKIEAGDARFMILREDANAGKEGVA